MENKIITLKQYVVEPMIKKSFSFVDNNDENKNKIVILNSSLKKEVKIHDVKIKMNRKISMTDKWKLTCIDLQSNNNNLKIDNHIDFIIQSDNINELVKSQIRQKINGYRWQDIKKSIFCCSKFIDYEFVIELLKKSKGLCFYCQLNVQLIYDYIREPKQWTIERIDNTMGHNKDNVEISCLNCNLRRRTMHYERYLLTKQLKINKID